MPNFEADDVGGGYAANVPGNTLTKNSVPTVSPTSVPSPSWGGATAGQVSQPGWGGGGGSNNLVSFGQPGYTVPSGGTGGSGVVTLGSGTPGAHAVTITHPDITNPMTAASIAPPSLVMPGTHGSLGDGYNPWDTAGHDNTMNLQVGINHYRTSVGLPPITEDGKFGPKTKDALADFMHAHGLHGYAGEVNDETLGVLAGLPALPPLPTLRPEHAVRGVTPDVDPLADPALLNDPDKVAKLWETATPEQRKAMHDKYPDLFPEDTGEPEKPLPGGVVRAKFGIDTPGEHRAFVQAHNAPPRELTVHPRPDDLVKPVITPVQPGAEALTRAKTYHDQLDDPGAITRAEVEAAAERARTNVNIPEVTPLRPDQPIPDTVMPLPVARPANALVWQELERSGLPVNPKAGQHFSRFGEGETGMTPAQQAAFDAYVKEHGHPPAKPVEEPGDTLARKGREEAAARERAAKVFAGTKAEAKVVPGNALTEAEKKTPTPAGGEHVRIDPDQRKMFEDNGWDVTEMPNGDLVATKGATKPEKASLPPAKKEKAEPAPAEKTGTLTKADEALKSLIPKEWTGARLIATPFDQLPKAAREGFERRYESPEAARASYAAIQDQARKEAGMKPAEKAAPSTPENRDNYNRALEGGATSWKDTDGNTHPIENSPVGKDGASLTEEEINAHAKAEAVPADAAAAVAPSASVEHVQAVQQWYDSTPKMQDAVKELASEMGQPLHVAQEYYYSHRDEGLEDSEESVPHPPPEDIKGASGEGGGAGVGRVIQAQGGTRNQKLNDPTNAMLLAAAKDAKVNFRVFSGAQSANHTKATKGKPGGWTGSVRHNKSKNGIEAADGFLVDETGRTLDYDKNPKDRAVYVTFIKSAIMHGATGFGYAKPGEHYMERGSIHVGGGSRMTWGQDGDSGRAPKWLRDAVAEGFAEKAKAATSGGESKTRGKRADVGGGEMQVAGALQPGIYPSTHRDTMYGERPGDRAPPESMASPPEVSPQERLLQSPKALPPTEDLPGVLEEPDYPGAVKTLNRVLHPELLAGAVGPTMQPVSPGTGLLHQPRVPGTPFLVRPPEVTPQDRLLQSPKEIPGVPGLVPGVREEPDVKWFRPGAFEEVTSVAPNGSMQAPYQNRTAAFNAGGGVYLDPMNRTRYLDPSKTKRVA